MSEPILPLLEWPEGIQQARVPANDNALRVQALVSAAVDVSNDGAGAVDGNVFIVGSAPTGDLAEMSENDIALYEFGSWYAWAPVAGIRMVVNNVRKLFNGTAWVDDPAGGGGSGDVTGPGSSTDNTLPRFDGTTGKTLQASDVAVTDNNEISGYRGHLNQQTGTTYTLQASDAGKIVELANGSAIALTAANSLPVGFCCTIVQGGAGQVTVASTGSGSVVNRQSQFKTAGQNAMCSIYVRSNSGTNAVFVFGGDTAA